MWSGAEDVGRDRVKPTAALGLAGWIVGRRGARAGVEVAVSLGELSALCFYAYGALLAAELDAEIGEVVFEAGRSV